VAGIEAAQVLESIVSGFIDAFPILGAFVDSVMDFVTEQIQAGAVETLAANGNYFKEIIQCELYCLMKCDCDDITAAYLDGKKGELISWGAALPPQTPLLVIIGQIFALWLETVPAEELLRRANIYKNTTANCGLCEDCEDCPTCEEVEYLYLFNSPSEGYSIVSGTQETGYISGVQIPSAGFPEYDIPGVAATSSRGAYVYLNLNALVARVSVTFNFRRFTGSTSGVGYLLYCYDDANEMMFGGPLGGSVTLAQDVTHTLNFDISAAGTCLKFAILAVNFGTSDINVQHIHILEAQTYMELP